MLRTPSYKRSFNEPEQQYLTQELGQLKCLMHQVYYGSLAPDRCVGLFHFMRVSKLQ